MPFQYFENDLENLSGVESVTVAIKVFPVFELKIVGSIDAADLIIIGINYKVHVTNR